MINFPTLHSVSRSVLLMVVAEICVLPATGASAGTIASGPSCIATNRIVDKKGYVDRSRVEFTNRCNRPVSAWVCSTQGREPGVRCEVRFGSYSSIRFAPGQTVTSSMPSGVTPLIDVRECPAGLNAVGNGSPFNCQ